MKLQKGAMFGIDARIALIIFAILGAIAAYYGGNKINKAQITSIIKQIESVRLAFIASATDNGSRSFATDPTANINDDGFNTNSVATSNDLRKGKQNYNYLQNIKSATNDVVIQSALGDITIDSAIYSSSTSDASSAVTTDCDETFTQCYYWLKISNLASEYYPYIEEYFDGDFIPASPSVTEHSNGKVILSSITDDYAVVYISIGRRIN